MREVRILLSVGLLAVTALSFSQSTPEPVPTLKVGDPAPAFAPREWLKGKPIKGFEKGKVYVVEFWATWCGPCRGAMPELSKLAKQYEGRVTFIGVNVWESMYQSDKSADYMPKVRNFVKKIGDAMDYNVAADHADGRLAQSWLTAAGQRGIPASFLVDGEGKIVWTGHPGALANQLLVRVDGKEPIVRATREENLKALATYRSFIEAGNYKEALAFVEGAIVDPKYPHHRDFNQLRKYTLLTHLDPGAARAYGEQLLKESTDDPGFLGQIADAALGETNALVTPAANADRELAIKALDATYAMSIPEDVGTMRSIAAAYFKAGKPAMAVKVQETLLKHFEADKARIEASEKERGEMQEELQKYKAALKKG